MKSKFTLHLRDVTGDRSVELSPECILANDVVLPGEHSPYSIRLWVIGNEFGALGAVWAENEQDALDELVDAGLGEALLIKGEVDEEDDSVARLGNAGEPADLTYAWMSPVVFEPARDWKLLCAFAEARGGLRRHSGLLTHNH